MPRVSVRNGNIEAALRVFKRKVTDSGNLIDYRDKQFFEKKSCKRNKNRRAASIREQKRQQKDT